MYSYVAANANLCEIAIRLSDDLVELIKTRCEDEGELKVCAFGGGPGTELLALTKYLTVRRKKGPQVALSFLLVDNVPEWVETWSQLEAQVRKFLKDNFGKIPSWPLNINKAFMPFDMTDLKKFGNVKQLFGQDLYIFNYVVSEIYGAEEIESLQEVVQAMADSAATGSKFLIVDRRQNPIINRATELLENSGLSVDEATPNISNMDPDEQHSDLGDQLIAERSPRVTWNAFWIIGTKE